MKGKARFYVAFYAMNDDGDLAELRWRADRIDRDVSLLERLVEAGWVIVCLDEEEEGVVEYAAEREFNSPLAAMDAALAVGVERRDFEWSGDGEFYTVGNAAHRQWLIENCEPVSPRVEDGACVQSG